MKKNNEIKLPSHKQSVEGVLIQGAVETTLEILYDKESFDNYDNANEVLKKTFCVLEDVDFV